jgi:hypothetical protein
MDKEDNITRAFELLLDGYTVLEVRRKLLLSLEDWAKLEKSEHFKEMFYLPYQSSGDVLKDIETLLWFAIDEYNSIDLTRKNQRKRAVKMTRIENLKFRYSTYLLKNE